MDELQQKEEYLFEENEENFYTYNREDNSFGNIQGEKESKLEENER